MKLCLYFKIEDFRTVFIHEAIGLGYTRALTNRVGHLADKFFMRFTRHTLGSSLHQTWRSLRG